MKATCDICPRRCVLEEEQTGLCRARKNLGGIIICENYGKITSIALDPIEKKPLRLFYPGSKILSVGSYGCNLHCPFCQNSDIAAAGSGEVKTQYYSPENLIKKALELIPQGNIGIAYTYNEPLVGYEYVRDCAQVGKQSDLKTVVVTNGLISDEPFRKLLPKINAMNIDLKGFTNRFYKMIGGDLDTVKKTIVTAAKLCHIEVTTLIVPGQNDSDEEITQLSKWLSAVNPKIPLHITRFFPRWKMSNATPTPVSTINRLAGIARKSLQYVYEGNC